MDHPVKVKLCEVLIILQHTNQFETKTWNVEMMDHLIQACPNILALKVGRSSGVHGDNVNFLSAIQFHNLRSLSLHNLPLSDGSFLPSVKKKYNSCYIGQ